MDLHEINELAYENGYHVVNTTIERSGYPRYTSYAIVDFDSFKEAEEFADKHGMRVVLLTKRDGWDFWYNDNERLIEARS